MSRALAPLGVASLALVWSVMSCRVLLRRVDSGFGVVGTGQVGHVLFRYGEAGCGKICKVAPRYMARRVLLRSVELGLGAVGTGPAPCDLLRRVLFRCDSVGFDTVGLAAVVRGKIWRVGVSPAAVGCGEQG